MHLVIPVADEPANPTLSLALWSALEFAPWLQPVLIGPPLAVTEYVEGTGFIVPWLQQVPSDPVGNTTRMLRAAIAADDISDPFVWSADDIFFRAAVDIDDLYLAGSTANGKLEASIKTGIHGRLWHATKAALRAIGRPTWSYERHVPLVVNKAEMRRALAVGDGLLPRSVYQNQQLDEPSRNEPDVKVFGQRDLTTIPPGPIFSTGDRFPLELIRTELGLS